MQPNNSLSNYDPILFALNFLQSEEVDHYFSTESSLSRVETPLGSEDGREMDLRSDTSTVSSIDSSNQTLGKTMRRVAKALNIQLMKTQDIVEYCPEFEGLTPEDQKKASNRNTSNASYQRYYAFRDDLNNLVVTNESEIKTLSALESELIAENLQLKVLRDKALHQAASAYFLGLYPIFHQ